MSAKKTLESLGVPNCRNVGKMGGLPPLVGHAGRTDYPKVGDNLEIDFENSKYALFPLNLAIEIASTYPKAWCRGGNHFGNYAFEHYFNAMQAIQDGRKIPNDSLRWMKKREQYIARHRKDFRLAGIIAMIKWAGYVDGPDGYGSGAEDGSSVGYMVYVIDEYGK